MLPFVSGVLSGKGLPPVAAEYHLRSVPAALRLANVGLTTPQTVWLAFARGAGVIGETRILSRLIVADPALRMNLILLKDLAAFTAGVSLNTRVVPTHKSSKPAFTVVTDPSGAM